MKTSAVVLKINGVVRELTPTRPGIKAIKEWLDSKKESDGLFTASYVCQQCKLHDGYLRETNPDTILAGYTLKDSGKRYYGCKALIASLTGAQ